MRYLYYIFILFFISCNKSDNNTRCKEKVMSCDFNANLDVSTINVELDEILEIQDWYIHDTLLICKNDVGTPFYYTFDLATFKKVNSFGQKGNGPTEWISPQLVSNQKDLFVIDNQTKNIHKVDSIMSKIGKSKEVFAINYLHSRNYPICSYLTYSPKETSIKLYNIENDSLVEEFLLVNKEYKQRFSYDINGNKLVTAYNRVERITIYSIEEDYSLSPSITLNGSLSESPNQYYYSDVVCDEKYFYLLSQKNVNFKNIDGYSQIEVYDYLGNNIALIKLDILAKRMLMDKINDRFILLSQMDDNLHIANIPKI